MENINNTNIPTTPIVSAVSNIPNQPSKSNVFKYLFIASVIILLVVIISFVFILKNANSKTSSIKESNNDISYITPTTIPTNTINEPTSIVSNQKIKSKIRTYTYKFDNSKTTGGSAETFPSIASTSLGQMYVGLILEEEDTSNWGSGPILKDFILTVLNKQMQETYQGSYSEKNGKIILNFENQLTKNYEMPKTLTLEMSENDVVIDGIKLVRNYSTTKTYGYTDDSINLKEIPSINPNAQIYVRLVLDTEQVNPESFSPRSFLLTTFNKQEQLKYIGQYSINGNKLILNYTDNNKEKSITFNYNNTSVVIDNVEFNLIQ